MSVFDINKYDEAVAPVLERMAKVWGKNNKPYKMIENLLVHHGTSYAVRSPEHFEELLRTLSKLAGNGLVSSLTIQTDKNFVADDLVSHVDPSLRSNKIFSKLANDICSSSAQRSAGKGEILLSLLCTDSQKAKKHGDVNVGGKNLELKSDVGTIHQEEENKFRKNDELIFETFGFTRDKVKNNYKSYRPLPTFLLGGARAREFYSKIYRNWDDTKLDAIENAWNSTSCPDRRSAELGYQVLLDYVQHKGIDGLLLTEEQKCGRIKAVYIQDFSDKDFIFANVTLKPQKMRGGSTEARPDGLVNISIK